MTWLKIDDGFIDNRKVDRLSDRAFRLYLAGLCFCSAHLTDGILLAKDVRVVSAKTRATKRHVLELVEGELWLPAGGGGYQVKDFLIYNPTAAKVKQDREEARKRMARLRERSGEQNGERSRTRSGSPSRPVKEKTLGEQGLFRLPAVLAGAAKAALTGEVGA